jgi:hypothetical protein
MVKAPARAFRWRGLLDTGSHPTLEDLARAKGVNATYASRILRPSFLAPGIAEAILDGRNCIMLAQGAVQAYACRNYMQA